MKRKPELEQGRDRSAATDVDELDWVETIKSLISSKGIVLILGGAAFYFLGWRYIFSYYAAFGLDPVFFSFSPTDIIFAGWRVYIVVLCLLVAAAYILFWFRSAVHSRITPKNEKKYIVMFLAALAASIVLVGYEIYQYFLVLGAHSTTRFFVWAFLALFLLYVTYLLGVGIHSIAADKGARRSVLRTIFRVIFPLPEIWALILGLALIFVLAAFSSFEGLLFSLRDQGERSRLQIAAVYVNKPLDIPGIQTANSGTWKIDNLRVLFKTEDMYFFFRPEEAKRNNGVPLIYSIPQASIEQIILKAWFDTYVNPIPTITPTP